MASINDTQNSSVFNTSNIEQKKEYHKLLDKLSLLDNDSVDNEQRVESTMQVLVEANNLTSAATANTSVALLDSYVLRQAGRQALTAASNIEANSNVYNAGELALHICENPSLWAFALPRRVASAATLHGAFEPAPPPQRTRAAPRRRAETQRNAAVRRPDIIATLEQPQEDTVMVSRVRRIIEDACRHGPLSFFHCVLDPDSFARSVQNIYYVSFLVRDGKVAIYVDKELGIPMIRPMPRAPRVERDISQENQFILSINMELWQRLIRNGGIKKAMLTYQ